ncbi:MAG: thermopsin family protease [Pyrobaculum sp.]
MRRLVVLILLLSAGLVTALVTVPPMRGDFTVAHWGAEGPGFVAVVGIDDEPHNITLFTKEGFNQWMKKNTGTAVYNGMLKRGSVLIIETPSGDYVLAVYPLPFLHGRTQTYAKSYSGWAPVGAMSLPREPLKVSAAAGYFEVRRLKARGFENVRRSPGVNGTSIQLNAMVVLELADGSKQYYFVQNAVVLNIDEDKYSFLVNIYNHTSKSKDLSRGAISGRGDAYWSLYAWSYYGYMTHEKRLSLPFAGFLIINVTAVGGVAKIDFGYNTGGGVVWYDSVTVRPYAPVARAYIFAGHAITPIYTIASLELVLCAYGGGTFYAELEDVDMRLALLVWDGARWRPAPRIFNFGFNTDEAVSLNVETRLVNGTVHITRGMFKPMLLAEEPPEPDIPPPNAVTKPQTDSWLFVAVAVVIMLMLVVIYRAGSALIDKLARR